MSEMLEFLEKQGLATFIVLATFGAGVKYLPTFMENHKRIADASEESVNKLDNITIGLNTLRGEVKEVESAVKGLESEVKSLKENHQI